MGLLELLADGAVPVFIVVLLTAGLLRRVPVFEEFVAGAGEGLQACVRVLPPLVALITAVSMLQASGLMDSLAALVAPVVERIGLPAQVVPLALMRPVSGSGSLAVLENVLSHNGPDSVAGLVASVLQCSTEPTFYTIAVYYGTIGVKRTRHTLAAAAVGDMAGVLMAALTVRMLLL